jgi:hypothetical protein
MPRRHITTFDLTEESGACGARCSPKTFLFCFRKFVQRRTKCVEKQGDYVERIMSMKVVCTAMQFIATLTYLRIFYYLHMWYSFLKLGRVVETPSRIFNVIICFLQFHQIQTYWWWEERPCRNSSYKILATGPEVPGSIPGATRFSEKKWVWNGVNSAS